jgi:hypothetical protein
MQAHDFKWENEEKKNSLKFSSEPGNEHHEIVLTPGGCHYTSRQIISEQVSYTLDIH